MENEHPNNPGMRSFASTLLAIAWSFAGLRRRKDFEQDIGRLNPLYVVAAAVMGVAVLVGLLMGVVRYAVT